jgi:hypothetical protein
MEVTTSFLVAMMPIVSGSLILLFGSGLQFTSGINIVAPEWT